MSLVATGAGAALVHVPPARARLPFVSAVSIARTIARVKRAGHFTSGAACGMLQPSGTIEADTVARYIAERQAPSPCMTWADTLGNMAALDAWRGDVGLVFDCER